MAYVAQNLQSEQKYRYVSFPMRAVRVLDQITMSVITSNPNKELFQCSEHVMGLGFFLSNMIKLPGFIYGRPHLCRVIQCSSSENLIRFLGT